MPRRAWWSYSCWRTGSFSRWSSRSPWAPPWASTHWPSSSSRLGAEPSSVAWASSSLLRSRPPPSASRRTCHEHVPRRREQRRERPSRVKNRATILILGTAQFVMVLDTTVMNVSITQVVDDLDTTVSAVQLAITAYALVMAAFMLTGAKLGDTRGRRRIFAIGLGVYGTGSLITALSPNVGVLLFGWSFVEGIGATLVIPAIAALTAANYTGKERALAYGLLGGIAGAAVAAGPLIGGFVTSALTWRVVFAGETVVVVGILAFGIRHIKDSPAVSTEKLDIPGVALSALGLGLVVFGVLKSSSWGLITPTGALTVNGTKITPFGLSVVPFIIAAGAIVLMAFRRFEQHQVRVGRAPLLSPDLLKLQQLRA